MADEEKEVNTPAETSPLEGAVASSPEVQQKAQEAQETEPSTPQKEETQEPEQQAEEQSVPYGRFKEVNDEKNWFKSLAEKQQQQLNQPSQQPPTAQDPYAGMDAETKAFWQRNREIAREEAQKVLKPQADAAVTRIANLEIQNFRMRHPEVKPNSELETRITQRVNQGYPLEDAFKLETYETRVGQSAVQKVQTNQQRLEAKKKANVASPQSNSANLSNPPNLSFKEDIAQQMRNTSLDELLG